MKFGIKQGLTRPAPAQQRSPAVCTAANPRGRSADCTASALRTSAGTGLRSIPPTPIPQRAVRAGDLFPNQRLLYSAPAVPHSIIQPDPQKGRHHGAGLFIACLVQKSEPKNATVLVTSNLTAYVWSTKCRRKKKLITQFSCKSRDKSFEPN
jgi:hypothetical protein